MWREQNNRGVTFVEIVASIVVLGIALPPLIAVFTEVAGKSPDHTYQVMARTYADSLMEEIASKAFEDPDEAPGSFGAEEGARAAYDDIDDYDGLSNSPPQHFDGTLLDDYGGFTRGVLVANVTAADTDPSTAAASGTTAFKRIRVAVTWTGARGGEVVLSTLRTNKVITALGGASPLDEVASGASAARIGDKTFALDLVSISNADAEIAAFSMSSSVGAEELHRLKLEGDQIWHEHDVFLPNDTTDLNDGSTAERTVPAGAAPLFSVEFADDQSGTVAYTLVLYFTNGSSSTLSFTIAW